MSPQMEQLLQPREIQQIRMEEMMKRIVVAVKIASLLVRVGIKTFPYDVFIDDWNDNEF